MVEEAEGPKPVAFVIMPFGEAFDQIYNLFLTPTLIDAGYEVSRADDIRSSRNILEDIVRALVEATLVVADLTDSNANVYYELGLAHAMGKPVILLAQEIDELPFDLRSYRVIPYKTHFAEMERAKKQLTEIASGLLDGSVRFGSPVSDFVPDAAPRSIRAASTPEEGEPGFLDQIIALEEGFESLTGVMEKIGTGITRVGEATSKTTARLQALSTQPGGAPMRQARALVIGLAETLSAYAAELGGLNDEYSGHLSQVAGVLESVVRAQRPRTDEEWDQLRSYLENLNALEAAATESLTSITQMIETLRETPPAERSYSRARDRAVAELQVFVENIQKTVSIVSRARDIGEAKLRSRAG